MGAAIVTNCQGTLGGLKNVDMYMYFEDVGITMLGGCSFDIYLLLRRDASRLIYSDELGWLFANHTAKSYLSWSFAIFFVPYCPWGGALRMFR